MTQPLFFFLLFVAFGLGNFAISVAILRRLLHAGIKVSFFEIRWQIHKHLRTYRELGLKDDARVPPLYYGYWITLAALLSAAILALASLPAS